MGFYITVERNVKIFVEDLDPGNGRTILFIHGWPLNHKMFEYQFDQLPKKGYRCIGMDLRGFGKSDRPWKGYTYNRLAEDIRIVIDKLGLEDIILVGHSMGGAIATRYMARYNGHKVSKLVLIGAANFSRFPYYPCGLTREEIKQWEKSWSKLINATYTDRPKMLDGVAEIFFARYVSNRFKDWLIHSLGLEASGHATAKCAFSLREEDLGEDMTKIYVPTGIFHGVQDKVCPFSFAKLMHANIRGSKLIPFKYSGHGLFYEELEKFQCELIRFMENS